MRSSSRKFPCTSALRAGSMSTVTVSKPILRASREKFPLPEPSSHIKDAMNAINMARRLKAQASDAGRQVYLGIFVTAEEAALLR